MADVHIMVKCQKVGCPRSIAYCFKCDDMKDIKGATLTCGWNDTKAQLYR